MKTVKVSLLLKIVVFLINLLLLLNLLIISQNIFGFINLIPLLFLGINFVLFFYVLKNNRLFIKLFVVFLLFTLGGFNYLFSSLINNDLLISSPSINELSYFITIPYALFLILILLNLYFLDKKIKKGVDKIDINSITEKNQTKPFIILFIITFIILVVYRFGYYTIEKDINKVDDSFFITKYEDKNIEDDNNLYNELKIFKYNKNDNYEDIIFSLSKKNFYKSDIYEYTIFTEFINFNYALNNEVLLYMNEGDEKQAIKILVAQINTSYTLFNGDSLLTDKLVAHDILLKVLNNIDFILQNYKLSNSSKDELKKVLDNPINTYSLDNSLKNEYKQLLFDINIEDLNNDSTLFYYNYTKKGFKEMVYNRIKNKGQTSDVEFNKYDELNYSKSNIIGQILWKEYLIPSYESQYNNIDKLNKFRLDLIDKLNK